MQYTPGQLRDATGIASETFRHWKKVLRPLRSERGHSPCFASGDLVAVAIIRALTFDLGIRVGALSAVAEHLFEVCNATPWPALERSNMVIVSGGDRVLLVPELETAPFAGARVVVPLRPIIAALRVQLVPTADIVEQPALRFPPHGLAAMGRP